MTRMEVFANEPLSDFSDAAHHTAQTEALIRVRGRLGSEYPILVGGEEIRTNHKLTSINPARIDEVVGEFQQGTAELADRAVRAARDRFDTWKRTPAGERAEIAFRAAAVLRRRRFEINAWMIYEAGKSWIEADADTAEAIDFLEFYGREALRYHGPQPVTPVPGEDNTFFYIPLGAGAVLSPWNFPLAILCGMTTAAWVTGNTAVVKPASATPMMGRLYMDVVREAGLPDGVVNFVTGPGSRVGSTLVEHPFTRFVSFTGSKEAGLEINAGAGRTAPGQIWIKRVVAEMGGKNSILVDREADLDDAVSGVLASAFGFGGQKCSACSRAVVDERVYDRFVERLTEAAGAIVSGDPEDSNVFLGPVIDKPAFDKIMSYVAAGRREGRLLTGGGGDDRTGYFIQPTVFADVDPRARIAQEEIFGPVLAVIKASNWDHALDIANNTEFGLTGSVYTRDKDKQKQAIEEFHVGNLYINRKCTGAKVGGHPFGGFNMSGTDSKAGGRDYLLLFLQAKAVASRFR